MEIVGRAFKLGDEHTIKPIRALWMGRGFVRDMKTREGAVDEREYAEKFCSDRYVLFCFSYSDDDLLK